MLTNMRHVDILLPKLLCQALRERAQTKLANRQHAVDCSGLHGRTGAREQQSPTRASALVCVESHEGRDHLMCEGKGGDDICIDALLNLLCGDLHERLWNMTKHDECERIPRAKTEIADLPSAVGSIKQRNAEGRGGPLSLDRGKRVLDGSCGIV